MQRQGAASKRVKGRLDTPTAAKLGELYKLNGIEDRKGTEYLLSDEMIDVGVQVGLYAVFWIIEATRQVRVGGQRKASRASCPARCSGYLAVS